MKVVFTIIATRVVELKPENYEQGMSEYEMIQLDKEAIEEDPFAFIDTSDVQLSVHAQKLPG